jgi:hypothetical protein
LLTKLALFVNVRPKPPDSQSSPIALRNKLEMIGEGKTKEDSWQAKAPAPRKTIVG